MPSRLLNKTVSTRAEARMHVRGCHILNLGRVLLTMKPELGRDRAFRWCSNQRESKDLFFLCLLELEYAHMRS